MVGNCKDCVHYETCSEWNKKFIDLRIKEQSVCNRFKNKADFVEVVRCKDCKKWTKEHTCKEFTADRSPLRGKVTFVTEPDDFCSYGERSDT